MTALGVIGGTGVEQWPDTRTIEVRTPDTPFGPPSAPLVHVALGDRTAWFVSRHGERHDIAPHRINYRANIHALHEVGVRRLIALNAVGIIGDAMSPGGLTLPDQIIDYTSGRENTFFDGVAAPLQHVDFSAPYDEGLRSQLVQAAQRANVRLSVGGTYGATQGPRLETRAEVDRLERDGVQVIGMTGMPEAALARELGIDYACVALVVNHAAGRGVGQGDIHAELTRHMGSARDQAMTLLREFINSVT